LTSIAASPGSGAAPSLAPSRIGAAVAAALVLLLGALLPNPHPCLQGLVLAALLLALWGVGRGLAGLLAPDLPRLSSIVATFTFAAAFGSVAATTLGHLGLLRPTPFLLVAATAALAAAFAPRPVPPVSPALPQPAAPGGPTTPLVTGDRPWRAGLDALEWTLAAAAMLAMVLGYLGDAVRRFAQPLTGGPDDLSYHLSAIAVWQRWGDLRMMKFSMGDWGTVFYPILPELSGWILLTPFRDSDVATRWAELAWAVASFVALASLARRLGLAPRAVILAVVLHATLNRVAMLAFAAGNDHVTAFCTLAALDAALACAQRPRVGRFTYLGVALGLLVASKYLGLYYAATILALAVLALALRGHAGVGTEDRERLRPVLAVGAVLAAMALAGGYTYLRNWVTTGNPVYPQPVQIAGLELYPGRPELSLGSRLGGEQAEIDVWAFLAGRDNRFAVFFPFTLLPAALLAPLVAGLQRRWLAGAVLALPLVFFLEFLYLTWDHRDIRYVFAGVALAAIAFAWLSERLGTVGACLRVGLLAVLVLRSVRLWGTRGTLEVVAALLLVGAVELARRRWGRRLIPARAQAAMSLLAAGLALAMVALGCGVERYREAKLGGSPAAMALEQMVGARGATVAYAGLNQPYLFFGSRLQNDVRILPRSFNVAAEFYNWRGVAEPLPPGRYSRWRSMLRQAGVRYVVIFRTPDEDPERRWMANHWREFHRVHVDEQIEIWRVVARPR